MARFTEALFTRKTTWGQHSFVVATRQLASGPAQALPLPPFINHVIPRNNEEFDDGCKLRYLWQRPQLWQ